jgi:hypothetical protein
VILPTRRRSVGAHVKSIVPPIAGWRSYPHALANLLLFGLALVAGTWIVHQTEYEIEYGSRFGAVMATSPHRFYMAPLGLALGVSGIVLLSLVALLLLSARRTLRALLCQLTPRLARRIHVSPLGLSWQAASRTTLALASLQMVLYLLQENLESAAVSAGWPGLWVLLAPQHLTVIPLHFLAAFCGALLLWTLSARLCRSRQAVGVARTLARVLAAWRSALRRLIPVCRHLPNLRLIAGVLCLRSPPLYT